MYELLYGNRVLHIYIYIYIVCVCVCACVRACVCICTFVCACVCICTDNYVAVFNYTLCREALCMLNGLREGGEIITD